MLKRHSRKGQICLYKKYFRQDGLNNWQFYTKVKNKNQETIYLDLASAGRVHIRRHVKIRVEATPFRPEFREYFEQRDRPQNVRKTKGMLAVIGLDTRVSRAIKKMA